MLIEKTWKHIKLNNGEMEPFFFSGRRDFTYLLTDYVRRKKKELGISAVTSSSLLEAPWMPTLSEVIHKTYFHSLAELADTVNRKCSSPI